MLNVRDFYSKLVKEFMVKNDNIAHGLVNFISKLFVGKDVLDISLLNFPVIDESDMKSTAASLIFVPTRNVCCLGMWRMLSLSIC